MVVWTHSRITGQLKWPWLPKNGVMSFCPITGLGGASETLPPHGSVFYVHLKDSWWVKIFRVWSECAAVLHCSLPMMPASFRFVGITLTGFSYYRLFTMNKEDGVLNQRQAPVGQEESGEPELKHYIN